MTTPPLPKEHPMTLEEARAILRAEDATDSARALEAIAMVLRFEGISEPRLLRIAGELEQTAAELKAGGIAVNSPPKDSEATVLAGLAPLVQRLRSAKPDALTTVQRRASRLLRSRCSPARARGARRGSRLGRGARSLARVHAIGCAVILQRNHRRERFHDLLGGQAMERGIGAIGIGDAEDVLRAAIHRMHALVADRLAGSNSRLVPSNHRFDFGLLLAGDDAAHGPLRFNASNIAQDARYARLIFGDDS